MAVDDTYLYWSHGGVIRAIPKAGGSEIVMFANSNTNPGLDVLETGWLHVTSQPLADGTILFKLPAGVPNGTPVPISKQYVGGSPLLEIGADLYCNGARKLPPNDAPAVLLEPLLDSGPHFQSYQASNVVTDGANLFWRVEAEWLEQGFMSKYDGRIRKLALGAKEPVDFVNQGMMTIGLPLKRIVASTTHVCYENYCYDPATAKLTAKVAVPVSDILLDEPFLYVLTGTKCKTIVRANTDGGKAEYFLNSPGNPFMFTQDAEYIYWIDDFDHTFYRKHK